MISFFFQVLHQYKSSDYSSYLAVSIWTAIRLGLFGTVLCMFLMLSGNASARPDNWLAVIAGEEFDMVFQCPILTSLIPQDKVAVQLQDTPVDAGILLVL